MKRTLSIFLSAMLLIAMMAGCSGGSSSQSPAAPQSSAPAPAPGSSTAEPASEPAPAGEETKDYTGQTLIFGQSYGANFDNAMNEVVIPLFKEKYGADVVMDPSYDYPKLLAESGNPSVDICTMDDVNLYAGKEMGVYTKLDRSKLTNADQLYEDAWDPNGNGVYVYWGRYGIVYNTEHITEKPTSWHDMWKDEYAGRVVINSPKGTGGTQFLVMTSYINGGDEGNMDPAWNALKELAPNLLTVADNTSALVDIFTRGDGWIAPCWDGRAYAMKKAGVPVDFAVPDEGGLATIAELVIPVGSKNEELAYLFMDLCLSEEAQKAISTWTRYGPVNKNVTFEGTDADEIFMASNQQGLVVIDWPAVAPVRNTWIETFDKEITGLLQ